MDPTDRREPEDAVQPVDHEPSEITYDEQLYPARPRRLRPSARRLVRPPARGRGRAGRRQPGLPRVADLAVDAERRERARPPALRLGEHAPEPLRPPRSARRDPPGRGLVHRLPALLRHPARAVVPRRARRRHTLGSVRRDRHRSGPHRPGEEGGRPRRLAADALRRRPLRPDQHAGRLRVRHRRRDAGAVRDGGALRRRDHRRHRPRPHRQGRRLPPRRDGLRRLPGRLPHGLDPARGLGPPARGPGRPRLGQPRGSTPSTSSNRPATSSAACSG